MERVWQADYANHPEAMRDVADYIVGFYNSVRRHSTLGYLSPIGYEQLQAGKKLDHYTRCVLREGIRGQKLSEIEFCA